MNEQLMLELWHKSGGDIYKYADLVAEHEREECASLCDEWEYALGERLARKIRAREQE
jgi:hypothetical protein